MIGQVVSHYRILERLGKGGMGEVYLAEDTNLGRRVAIKFPVLTSNEHDFRARFLREARAISELSNPHSATLYD
jgi:serine/threonine protein kinase